MVFFTVLLKKLADAALAAVGTHLGSLFWKGAEYLVLKAAESEAAVNFQIWLNDHWAATWRWLITSRAQLHEVEHETHP